MNFCHIFQSRYAALAVHTITLNTLGLHNQPHINFKNACQRFVPLRLSTIFGSFLVKLREMRSPVDYKKSWENAGSFYLWVH